MLKSIAIIMGALAAGIAVGYELRSASVEKELIRAADLSHDRQQAVLENNYAFRLYMEDHADTPSPRIEFPEIVASPELWDWTKHAVLRGEHEVKYWSGDLPPAYTVFSSATSTTAGGVTYLTPVCFTPQRGW